jgi:integrase/recombinase XerD
VIHYILRVIEMRQAKTLSTAELKRVIAVIRAGRHAERNEIAFLLSYYAGLRVKEIAALNCGDVYDSGGAVKRIVTLTAAQTKGSVGRTIVLNDRLVKALTAYARLLANKNCSELPLIRSQKGTAFSANSLCQVFLRIYADAGIDGASSHSGRRTFITNLAHKGVSAKVLMTLAGHRHLSTTQRYIDVNDEMLKAAVELA